MTNTQTGTVAIDGAELYYEQAGSGDALVLTHAAIVDSGMWDAQWEAFARHYRVIRYDMRGFGQSGALDAPVIRRNDLLHLLDHLGIGRAHLLGCSLGGEISIDFALEHPDRVASLIAVSAVPGGFELQGEPPPHLMDMFGALQGGEHERASELQMRVSLDGMLRHPEQVDPAIRSHAAQMNLAAVRRGTWAFDMAPVSPLDPPAVSRLGEIRVPALVIAGALDHPEILRAGEFMARQLPNARNVVIGGAAHLPNMEQSQEFNAAVLDFLNGLS